MRGLVHFARHGSHAEVGSVLSGRSEIALSDAGEREAHRLAARLAGTPIAAVHASPRARTMATAAIVAERHRLPVIAAAALDEIDFGAWSGRNFAELADDPAWARWNGRRGSGATPAGDTMAAAVARATDHIERLDLEGDLICVSHCDVIRGTVAHYLGLDADRLLSFDCDPGSLTTLAFDPGRVRLVTLNERPA